MGRNATGLAFHFARLLVRELSERADEKDLSAARKENFATGVETFAQRDPRFAVTIDEWDKDGFLLGTPHGTVDLRTGLDAAGKAEPAKASLNSHQSRLPTMQTVRSGCASSPKARATTPNSFYSYSSGVDTA